LETSEAAGELLLLVMLVALAGFFAGSEAGFLRVQRVRVRQAAEAGSKLAKILLALHERRSVVLATLLVGITGSYYVAEHIATVLGIEFLGPTVGPIVALVGITVVGLMWRLSSIRWWAFSPSSHAACSSSSGFVPQRYSPLSPRINSGP
jgi:Mg2+/Co2+ transporter CorB